MLPAVSGRERQKSTRREAILDVAAHSFLEHGYAGSTMSGIATTLGGSKGTLWSYFPSKELIFRAVIERMSHAFHAELSLSFPSNDHPEFTLQHFCRQFLSKVSSHEAIAFHRLIAAEVGRFPELGRIFYETARRPASDLLSSYIVSAMERGVIRQDDSQCAAQHLISLCMSGCYEQVLLGVIDDATPEIVEDDVSVAFTTFMRAWAR
jgi:TetR/AcrR family transcriptional regulator, mexJK operon transcriptional repressor